MCIRDRRQERAIKALQAVGLGERLYHKSNQMSGGQMQRVAIARALVNDPAVILADEATGNLDTRTSFEILILFQKLHAAGRTIIFVTHNPDIANYSVAQHHAARRTRHQRRVQPQHTLGCRRTGGAACQLGRIGGSVHIT